MARSEVNRPWRLWLGLAAVTLAVMLAISAHRGATVLTVTRYEIPAKVTSPLRIVQLSDLHSREFGDGNENLIALVAAQEPDLIFLTGDMLNRGGTAGDLEPLCHLIERLGQIAPVYWSDGNHEKILQATLEEDLHAALTRAGATVLDCTYADITLRGQDLRLGGYCGYYRTPHMTTDDPAVMEAENRFFEEFEDTHRLKLLLSHIPTSWVDWGFLDRLPVDLVFSGHYHGGQIRLPVIGGLYAPYVGFFPPNTRGVFTGERGRCILTAGLGAEPGLPRIGNLPEIVVADLIPQSISTQGGAPWKENTDTCWKSWGHT